MPMALCSQRPAAEKHAVWLFRPLELGWHAGIHHALYVKCREAMDRAASPAARCSKNRATADRPALIPCAVIFCHSSVSGRVFPQQAPVPCPHARPGHSVYGRRISSPSPFQLFAFDLPNELIRQFPLVLVPVFLVPVSVLLHLASHHLRTATGGRCS